MNRGSLKEKKELFRKLRSLGIALNQKALEHPVDIEETLIESLPYIQSDLKLLFLLLSWLQEMGDLVHIEKLKVLAKEIPPEDLAFLGAIANYTQGKFRKWNLLVSFAQRKLSNDFSCHLHPKMTLAIDFGASQVEESFEKFGLKIPQVILEDSRKLIPRKYLIRDNSRFRFRALFGTNWRADIAYELSQSPGLNAFQIKKRLGCSYETVHRIKKFLDEAAFYELKVAKELPVKNHI